MRADRLRCFLLSAAERNQLLIEWNATAAEYLKDKCIHELFEEQVFRDPAATAVIYEDQSLTYGELNARANRLAHHLRNLGVKPDAPVAICVERSLEMVVGLLAILKAGGCYVPLDPEYPAERLAFMLKDAAPRVVLTHGAARVSLDAAMAHCAIAACVVDLEADAHDWAIQPTTDPDPKALGLTSKHLAYIIYTSGSTGQPKGVMIEHQNANNLYTWYRKAYLSTASRVLIISSYSFDLTLKNIFSPLLSGGIAMLSRADLTVGRQLLDDIGHSQATVVNCAPSHFYDAISDSETMQMNTPPHSLRYVIFRWRSKFKYDRVVPWISADRRPFIVNSYGPTEITDVAVDGLIIEAINSHLVPIGRPISNTWIYLLDGFGNPVPRGVTGEIYIGGAGVARGYLNRADLTSERFIESPFVAGDRLYKTGDLGRYLADGNIEFLGRNDFQVKIRGFRIELGEIEARLTSYPGVREAIVLAREDEPGDKRLVAYYTVSLEGEGSGSVSGTSAGPGQGAEGCDIAVPDLLGAETLRAYLSSVLPDYMVPAAYVRLDALPLTPNGKLDRKALPAPEGDAYIHGVYEAPVGAVETTIAEIWSEVLGIERVGRHDNFFDLGGHSLLAIRILERMRRAGLQSDVRALFTTPVLSDLARVVGQGGGIVEVPANLIPMGCERITPDLLPLVALPQDQIDGIVATVAGGSSNVQDIYPLAPLQEGILFHHLMTREGDPYLLWHQMSFADRETLDRYISALNAVIARHDILRTAVIWEGSSKSRFRLSGARRPLWWRRFDLRSGRRGCSPRS